MGFRLNLRWAPSVRPSFASNSSSLPASYSPKGNEAFCDPSRMPFQSVIHEERVALLGDSSREQRYSLSTQAVENENTRGPGSVSYSMLGDNVTRTREANDLTHLTSFRGTKALYFSLLMKNLNVLEETIADSELVTLERDILVQLERIGALMLFQTCLSRTLKPSTSSNLSNAPSDLVKEEQAGDHASKVFIRSTRKDERRSRRSRPLVKSTKAVERHSKTNVKVRQQSVFSSGRTMLNYRSKRQKTARNEAEMSRGVKLVADLERIRTKIEEEVGQVVGTSCWSQAAGIDEKVLLEQMHFGWYCRDELLKSSRSLVLYIAKNYRGLGVAFEDLVQAGNMGVLQGAERFDHGRGYQFSTYVQYWIRKSIFARVAKHARGIRIPSSLSNAISQVQKAQKTLSNRDGKHPDVNEIAKFTGLTTAKIISASQCLRVVGSVDQRVGDFTSAKFLEIIPDTSMKSPEEAVAREHMITELYNLLEGLEPREMQVLLLRFGLKSHQRKSLEEIGSLFCVSKEWVRKIERKALMKLKKQDTFQNLSHHMYM